MQDMFEASKDKAIDDHEVIDEAIRDRGEGYMVFSVVRRLQFSLCAYSDGCTLACWCTLQTCGKEAEECSCAELFGATGEHGNRSV